MSKYFPKNVVSDIGQKIIKPNIDEETKNFIFSNISSGNFKVLYDKITPDITLTFVDNDNNSVTHVLLNVNSKLIPQETKIKLLTFFIRHGAPLNTYNKQKLTPLHIAINNGDANVVKFLIDNGANTNAETINKLLPIHLALMSKYIVCEKDVKPEVIGDIEKKDKNELDNALLDKMIELFDNKFYPLIDDIFKDHIKGSDVTKITDNIIKEVTNIQSNISSSKDDITTRLDEKKEEYIVQLAKELDKIDSDEIKPNLETLTNEQICDLYINDNTSKITTGHNEIYGMYNTKYNEFLTVLDNIIRLRDSTIDYFRHNLLINFMSTYMDGRQNKVQFFVPVENNLIIITGNININNNRLRLISRDPPIPIDIQLKPYTTGNYNNLYFNYITRMSNENKNLLKKIWNSLEHLNKIVNLINKIDRESFNPRNNLGLIKESLKFNYLNFIKICKIIELLTELLDQPVNPAEGKEKIILNFEINDDNYNSVLNNLINLNYPPPAGGAPVNQLIYNIPPHPAPPAAPGPLIYHANLRYRACGILDNIFGIINNNALPQAQKRAGISGIRKNNINLADMAYTLPKLNKCENYDNIRNKINEVNEYKYTLKYILDKNLRNTNTIAYYQKYFDKQIQDYNEARTQIKYKDNGETIINYPIPPILPYQSIIYAIDDVRANPTRYNFDYANKSMIKIFNDSPNNERQQINNIIHNDVNNNTSFNAINQELSKTENAIKRDDTTIELLTVNNQPLNLLRNLIIKDLLTRIFNNTTKETNFPDINILLTKYNYANIDKEFFITNTVKVYTNNLTTELLKYYKANYAKEILKLTYKNMTNITNYVIDNRINIDIRKLHGMDFKTKNDLFIDETKIKYYNYNYRSNDEALSCYKNNKDLILILVNQPTTNYFVKDIKNNSILHYLINIENFEFFKEIYINRRFRNLKDLKNNSDKTPKQIVEEKINFNNKQFYIIIGKNINQDKLLYSEIFSDELYTKLKNNNELNSNLPKNIKNLFDDLYVIFNLGNISINIFNGIVINNYESLFNYNKTSKWNLSANKNIMNIGQSTYNFFNKRHDRLKIYMTDNEYLDRFYNTIIHVLTLHLSNVFYHLIYKYLLESNITEIPIATTGKTENVSKIGAIKPILEDFKDVIFKYDPTFENQNLAQMIVINLYNAKYNKQKINNKSLSSLTAILKIKTIKLKNTIVESKKGEFNDEMDKIYDWMTIYFESFNKNISLFLTNYVRFIELQYNLQQIRNLL
jgi:hypothetical protein